MIVGFQNFDESVTIAISYHFEMNDNHGLLTS